MIGFGYFGVDQEDAIRGGEVVGRRLVEELERNGLRVEWDGDAWSEVEVIGLRL